MPAEQENNREKILEALKYKACTKQSIYRTTLEVFNMLKSSVATLGNDLAEKMAKVDECVEIEHRELGAFECRLKFSGDTLVFGMHTNVFTFDENHFIYKSPYVQEDPLRQYCGMIEIYDFLSDSFKYQRYNDVGYLIARLFVNKDKHFFVEGKRQLGFLYDDFDQMTINQEFIDMIVESAVLYSIDFDLWAPSYDEVKEITVIEKIQQVGNQSHKTGKRLGFQFYADGHKLSS